MIRGTTHGIIHLGTRLGIAPGTRGDGAAHTTDGVSDGEDGTDTIITTIGTEAAGTEDIIHDTIM